MIFDIALLLVAIAFIGILALLVSISSTLQSLIDSLHEFDLFTQQQEKNANRRHNLLVDSINDARKDLSDQATLHDAKMDYQQAVYADQTQSLITEKTFPDDEVLKRFIRKMADEEFEVTVDDSLPANTVVLSDNETGEELTISGVTFDDLTDDGKDEPKKKAGGVQASMSVDISSIDIPGLTPDIVIGPEDTEMRMPDGLLLRYINRESTVNGDVKDKRKKKAKARSTKKVTKKAA